MSRFLRNSPRFFLPLHRFPAGLAGWHSREGRSVSPSAPHPPSCAPFAPSPLRDFLATTGALTPAGHSPTLGQVSLIHVSDLPIPPSPTTPQALDADFTRYPSSRRVSCLHRSRLHHFPAGSPTLTGRIEFVILRMDRSPPAAPHPASRRRSCSRLQAGERIPEEDLHLSGQTRFQAHIGVGRAYCSPSLRTVQADLPHTALQSVVLPGSRIDELPHQYKEID
jgi:hypothetical protein